MNLGWLAKDPAQFSPINIASREDDRDPFPWAFPRNAGGEGRASSALDDEM